MKLAVPTAERVHTNQVMLKKHPKLVIFIVFCILKVRHLEVGPKGTYISKKIPTYVKLEGGKKYFWCKCGLSKKQVCLATTSIKLVCSFFENVMNFTCKLYSFLRSAPAASLSRTAGMG
jgi:hypothetical protein